MVSTNKSPGVTCPAEAVETVVSTPEAPNSRASVCPNPPAELLFLRSREEARNRMGTFCGLNWFCGSRDRYFPTLGESFS